MNKELKKLVGLIAKPRHLAAEPEFFLSFLAIHSAEKSDFFRK